MNTRINAQEELIEIITIGGHKIILSDLEERVTIATVNGMTIILDDRNEKVSVISSGDIEVSAATTLRLQAGRDINLEASGQVNIKGALINLN